MPGQDGIRNEASSQTRMQGSAWTDWLTEYLSDEASKPVQLAECSV